MSYGKEKIGDTQLENQEVSIGIRPEGFELDPEGPLSLNLQNVEIMGRDVSVVSTHEASQKPVIRSIISSDCKIDLTAEKVNYVPEPTFYQTSLEAPVKEGTVVGEVNLYKNGGYPNESSTFS